LHSAKSRSFASLRMTNPRRSDNPKPSLKGQGWVLTADC